MIKQEIETPALLVDLDRMEANLERMAAFFRTVPAKLRPHFKNHRSPELAARQLHAGAIGITCSTLHEAECLVEHGVRSVLLANEIAEVAQFFSFGTNDLTQMTMGLSRDDAGRFLPDYVDEKKAGIFPDDPFQSLDTHGVGLLIRWGIERGRSTRPKLKIGICGEHGGDAASVKFCHAVGMDYVSASPFRVPIARLAAAQAVIEDRAAQARAKKKKGKKK